MGRRVNDAFATSGHSSMNGISRNKNPRQKMRSLEREFSTPIIRSNTKVKNKTRTASLDRFEMSDSYLDYGNIAGGRKSFERTASKNQFNSSSKNGSLDRSKVRIPRPGIQRQKSASKGRTKSKSPPGPARRNRSESPGPLVSQQRSESPIPLTRQSSKHNTLTRQNSKGRRLSHQNSKTPKRQNSKPSGSLVRENSTVGLTRQKSKAGLARQASSSRGRPSLTRNASSKRQGRARSRSSSHIPQQDNSRELAPASAPPKSWKNRFRKFEERPKRGLVVIWLVVLAELGFDLGTTIIAFQAMLEDDDCCGHELNLGPLPLTVATPFIFLISLEVLMLARAVILTLWPSLMEKANNDAEESADGPKRSRLSKMCCACLKWNVQALLKFIHLLVLLNPFFGCVIAWMLLYQSDKNESFLVLGLEGGSIILHFISVKLEGEVKTFSQFLCHSVPLVPFFISVGMVLLYLKQEGVCYNVEKAVFNFQGCEICPDGFPPEDGNCVLANGTVVSLKESQLLDININDLDALAARTSIQDTFCGDEHDGYSTNFCFFQY
eukprot:scaffold5380_cov131-Cylindrotheca_fusiformis.AAC.33